MEPIEWADGRSAGTAEFQGVESVDRKEKLEPGFDEFFAGFNANAGGSAEMSLLPNEKELLREFIHGLRTIRYGSIVLTVHEGRLVEINKTVRIRRNNGNHKE